MKAMILAAGRGERLRPLTDTCPKPLVEVAGKPLIFYHLEALKKAGVSEVVINVCYMADKMMAALKEGQAWGLNIRYSVEEALLGSGGGIKKALALLGSDPFILVNADVFTDFSFDGFKSLSTKLAHLVLVPNPPQHPEGDYGLSQGMVKRRDFKTPSYTYAGIALLKPALFKHTQSDAFPLPSLFSQAIYSGEVSGELFEGGWSDVGTPERHLMLEQSLLKQKKKA